MKRKATATTPVSVQCMMPDWRMRAQRRIRAFWRCALRLAASLALALALAALSLSFSDIALRLATGFFLAAGLALELAIRMVVVRTVELI